MASDSRGEASEFIMKMYREHGTKMGDAMVDVFTGSLRGPGGPDQKQGVETLKEAGRAEIESRAPRRTQQSANGQSGRIPLVPPTIRHPPGPPRRPGPPSLVDGSGVVHNHVPGMGYQPASHFGVPIRDTTIGGAPRTAPTIGPAQPERILGGPPITGPAGQSLFKRAPGPFSGP
jgi:hypothetical protein